MKVERSANGLARFALPRRLLPFDEVKGSEGRAPCKRSLLGFAWPRRILPFDAVKGTNNLHGGSILAWSTLILRLFHFE